MPLFALTSFLFCVTVDTPMKDQSTRSSSLQLVPSARTHRTARAFVSDGRQLGSVGGRSTGPQPRTAQRYPYGCVWACACYYGLTTFSYRKRPLRAVEPRPSRFADRG